MTPAEREGGFTLVEVLVALVVAGLLVTILLDGATTAGRHTRAATDRMRALIVARTTMVRALATPYGTSESDGVVNGLRWHVTEDLVLADRRGAYGLAHVRVTVTTKGGAGLARLDGRRLKTLHPY